MIQQAKSNGPLAFVLASSIRRSGLRSTYLRSVFIISSRVFLLFCFCGPRQVVDSTFQVAAFGRGRCERRDKSSGPPLLKLSLEVKRNSAHSQSSVFVVAPVSRPQRAWSLKGPPRIHRWPFPDPRRAIEGVEYPGILSRRLQTGRHPLHRFGLGDHLIDVIAIDALKRAQLGSDARGLDTRQDHWAQTFGTDVGLNRYVA
jgi:hypothetical protein